jgi:hypothetical protein
MEISVRDLVTVLHGMGFGTLFMMAFSGAIGVIYVTAFVGIQPVASRWTTMMFRFYLVSMATLAWLTVLSGAYIIYPWYRAAPPAGTTDFSGYPRSLLLSNPLTAGWHNLGMEWKENVAWFAPIVMTMVAYVFIKYGPQIALHRQLRKAVLGFTAVAFMVAAIAGGCGAFLNKYAPVRGGNEIILLQGG